MDQSQVFQGYWVSSGLPILLPCIVVIIIIIITQLNNSKQQSNNRCYCYIYITAMFVLCFVCTYYVLMFCTVAAFLSLVKPLELTIRPCCQTFFALYFTCILCLFCILAFWLQTNKPVSVSVSVWQLIKIVIYLYFYNKISLEQLKKSPQIGHGSVAPFWDGDRRPCIWMRHNVNADNHLRFIRSP